MLILACMLGIKVRHDHRLTVIAQGRSMHGYIITYNRVGWVGLIKLKVGVLQ